MATSMDDILSDKPDEKPEAPAPEEKPEKPQAEVPAAEVAAEAPEKPERSKRKAHQRREWEAQGRDPETGQFVKKPETEAPAAAPDKPAKPDAPAADAKPAEKPAEKPAQPEMTDRERGLLQAAAAERRRRQELEVRLAQMAQPPQQQQTQQQPQAPKTFWDDPEGALKTHQEEIRRAGVQNKLQTAEMLARSRYKDFDEKIEKFAEIVQGTPGLAQQWLNAVDPGEFAYRVAANHMSLEAAGNLDNLRAEIEKKARAEERAKVEAEFKAKEEEAARLRAALPPSLSDVHGGGRKPAPAWTGPTSMSDILKH